MKIHELKTLPEYFQSIKMGKKNFEIRFNDRNFKISDVLCLREYDNNIGAYTGAELFVKVDYILDKFGGLVDGFVIMSISIIENIVINV